MHDDTSNELKELGIPVVRVIKLSESQRADTVRMHQAGFIMENRGGLFACHSKGFELLGRDKKYKTNSPATRPGQENSFAYPQHDGGWIINRLDTVASVECPRFLYQEL